MSCLQSTEVQRKRNRQKNLEKNKYFYLKKGFEIKLWRPCSLSVSKVSKCKNKLTRRNNWINTSILYKDFCWYEGTVLLCCQLIEIKNETVLQKYFYITCAKIFTGQGKKKMLISFCRACYKERTLLVSMCELLQKPCRTNQYVLIESGVLIISMNLMRNTEKHPSFVEKKKKYEKLLELPCFTTEASSHAAE